MSIHKEWPVSTDKIITGLLGIITTVALGLAGWSLNVTLSNKEEIKLMSYKLDQLQADSDLDNEQNRRLAEQRNTDRKFWKLHTAEKKEIDKLRVMADLPLVDWPNLSEHDHPHP